MESPAGASMGFSPTVNRRLRNCAFISDERSPPPSLLFGVTVECEEEVLNEDLGGETQVLVDEGQVYDKDHTLLPNLEGETQVVDHLDDGYETYMVTVEGDTQVLDGYERETQVHDAVYDQYTQGMHLGGETEVQDDDECVRSVCSQFVRNGIDCVFTSAGGASDKFGIVKDVFCGKKKPGHSHSKPLEQGSENIFATPPSAVEVDPGSFQRSFTSIRAASLRASGLAARCKALVETINNSWHTVVEKENDISCASHTPGSVHNHDMAGQEVNGDASMSEAVCSVARKLFIEEVHVENKNYGNEIDGEEEAKTHPLYLPDNGDEVAGLSYVDSQEPGDSTQANALDFIERFVKDNASDMQLDVCNEPLRRTVSKPAICARSFSNFSKKTTTFRQLVDQAVSFEWDEELEDEGGGDFFCRMKEKILNESGHKQRSLPQLQKSRRRAKLLGDKTDRMKFHDKSTAIQSDSKLQLFTLNRKGNVLDTTEANNGRNLQQDLDGEFIGRCSEELTEAAACRSGIQKIFSVGPDTQIAAEAMEALFCREPISGNDVNAEQGNLASVFTVAESKRATAKIPELEKKSSSDRLAIKQSKRKSIENKIVHKSGETRYRKGENEVNGSHTVEENIWHTNEEICPSVVARATRSMMLNQSNVLFNQADMALSKDFSRETNFEIGVVVPKRKRSRKYAGTDGSRYQSTLTDKSDGTHSNVGEIKLRERVVHEMSWSKVKTSGAENYFRRQHTSRHLNSQLVKSRDHNEMKSAKDGNKGSLRLSSNEGSAANRSAATSASCSFDAANIATDVRQKDISNHHSVEGIGMDAAGCGVLVKKVGKVSRKDKPTQRRFKPADSSCSTDNKAKVDNPHVGNICKRQLPANLSRSSLRKEISALLSNSPKSLSELKRKRRVMNQVRILFSNHLDADVIKHQKRILARLGASLAFSISDATHFVADSFVRTRNMLEAIALGKPVVTHLWLESCNQTSCLIDEKAYILRDAKKERELGFSMPDILVHASQKPLLQNRKVIITPNSKPSKEIIATLVKAVHGRIVDNFDDFSVEVDKYPDGVLVLSCIEDFSFCQPFLNEGVKVYSSELLLSGIVTQRLDYARHSLFDDHIRTAVAGRSRRGCW